MNRDNATPNIQILTCSMAAIQIKGTACSLYCVDDNPPKECTKFRYRILFVSSGNLEMAGLETPKMLMFAAASMSPFSATSFVGRRVANLALSRTIAAYCKHPVR